MPFRALVVDDDDAVRYTVRGFLERARLEVDEAVDGVDALEKIESKGFDLVVTDIQMPRLDGLELLAKSDSAPRRPRSSSSPRTGRSGTRSRPSRRARSTTSRSRSRPTR